MVRHQIYEPDVCYFGNCPREASVTLHVLCPRCASKLHTHHKSLRSPNNDEIPISSLRTILLSSHQEKSYRGSLLTETPASRLGFPINLGLELGVLMEVVMLNSAGKRSSMTFTAGRMRGPYTCSVLLLWLHCRNPVLGSLGITVPTFRSSRFRQVGRHTPNCRCQSITSSPTSSIFGAGEGCLVIKSREPSASLLLQGQRFTTYGLKALQ